MALHAMNATKMIMCERIEEGRSPPTYLFTPNFEDYTARAGDWAFEVRDVLSLREIRWDRGLGRISHIRRMNGPLFAR